MGSPSDEAGRYDREGPRHQVKISSSFQMAVVTVTWYQAFAFCRWLSASLPWARGARLPTEEEWEYACRAASEGLYWSGDRKSDLTRVGWYSANSEGRTHRVGRKPANPWGLYDVHGNVLEWTLTKPSYGYSRREAGVEVDPLAVHAADLAASGGAKRIVRGGSFKLKSRNAQSGYRVSLRQGAGASDLGFRVCLPRVPEQSMIVDH